MSIYVDSIFSEAPHPRALELREFLDALEVGHGRLSTESLESITQSLAARADLYEDLVVDDEVNRWWLQLFLTSNYDVRLLSWEHEQSSDWHDHGGSSGAWTVTAGTLFEQYRADDLVNVRDRRYVAGDHGSFGPAHVHDVIYESGSPAVSIHAYSPPLHGLTLYDRTDYGFVARDFVLEERRFDPRSPLEQAS